VHLRKMVGSVLRIQDENLTGSGSKGGLTLLVPSVHQHRQRTLSRLTDTTLGKSAVVRLGVSSRYHTVPPGSLGRCAARPCEAQRGSTRQGGVWMRPRGHCTACVGHLSMPCGCRTPP